MPKGLSVVICTYNGAHRIRFALEPLINIKVRFDWEVVVIDNNSSDNLENVLASFSGQIPIKLVKEQKQGLIYARWKAVEVVQFEYLLFCDDDNALNLDYFERGFSILEKNPKIGVLAGKGVAVFEGLKPHWFDRYQNFYAIGSLGRKNGMQKEGDLVYGAGLFFRKESLDGLKEIGFENLSFGRKGELLSGGEDLELTWGVMNFGYEYWYEEELIFLHFIECHRLFWNYNLKLMRSIASSYPLIESYKVNQFETTNELRVAIRKNQWKLFRRIILLTLKWVKSRNRVYFSYVLYHSYQFFSYFRNIKATCRNYENLKYSVFSKLNK